MAVPCIHAVACMSPIITGQLRAGNQITRQQIAAAGQEVRAGLAHDGEAQDMRRRILDERIARSISVAAALVGLMVVCSGCVGGKRSQFTSAQTSGAPAADGMAEGIEMAALPPFRAHRFGPSPARTVPDALPAVATSLDYLPAGDLSELGHSSECT
jgi:hypothetical protein